jgi:ATP-dependent DNA ligase
MATDGLTVRPPGDVVRPVAARELPLEDHWPSGPTRYEIKADGWRAVAAVLEEHRPVLVSRQGGAPGAMFPEVLEELRHSLGVLSLGDGDCCWWWRRRSRAG